MAHFLKKTWLWLNLFLTSAPDQKFWSKNHFVNCQFMIVGLFLLVFITSTYV